MASIYKVGKRWRAQVSIKGSRDTEVFATKQQASAWAMEKEAAGKGGKMPSKTLGHALARYAEEIAPQREGSRWETVRCAALGRHRIAKIQLADLSRVDLAGWRDERLKTVTSATVLRDLNLMRSVFRICRTDWGWLRDNPMKDLQQPKAPPSRKRRVTDDEITRIRIAAGLDADYKANTATERVGLAFLFALETAMRAGEIVGMTWDHVDLKKRFVRLPKTKNGDAREVPLTTTAVSILRALPKHDDGACFLITDAQRDALWRKVMKRAVVDNLHFHDTRAEGIWRLSKKLDVLQLARVIGHRDIRSLMLYYNESAADMAKRLD